MKCENRLFRVVFVLSLVGCDKADSKSQPAEKADKASVATLTSAASPSAPVAPAVPAAGLDPARVVVSCNMIKAAGTCAEWSGLLPSELKDAKGSCNDPDTVFSTARCPSDSLLGMCLHKEEKLRMFVYKSMLAPSLKEAKALCDDGEWTVVAEAPKAKR